MIKHLILQKITDITTDPVSMVYNFFDKKTSITNKGTGINLDIVFENKKLPKKLHKPIIKKFEKGKVH